jgi:Thiolase, N-terminal domain
VAISNDVSREDQDAFALASHQRAVAAIDAGRFEAELVPVTIRDAKGREIEVTVDENPRQDTSLEALARLKPAFDLPAGEDRGSATVGTVTAGNSPGITDGAAATVVASERAVERLGLKPLARIVGYAQAEVAPKWLFLAPIQGVRRLLDRIELPIEAFDLVEINRRSRPRRSPTAASWGSIGTGRTSTAARSHRATRSGRAARGSSRRCSTSSTGARAGTGSRRSAWAAAARSRQRSNALPDAPISEERSMDETSSTTIELSASEIALVRTALQFLLSTLGREEADELDAVQALLAKLEPSGA